MEGFGYGLNGIKVISKLVEAATEAARGVRTLAATRRSVSSLDPAMVLFRPIVPIGPG